MKHIFLIASLMLSITHTLLAMEINPSEAIQLCLEGIKEQNVDKVKQGLSLGANVNATNKKGRSLFDLASEKRNKDIINIIISDANIDLYSRNAIGQTPLYVACGLGLTTAVESILRRDPQTASICDQQVVTPLHLAATYGENDCITLLLPHSNINQQCDAGFTALHNACRFEQLETCRLLIAHGANVNQQNYDGNTPLHITEKADIIQLLLEKGACTTIQNNERETPLYSIYWSNDPEFLDNFQENVINQAIHATDEHKNTQLHLCATTPITDRNEKYKKYISFLISHNINIMAENSNGKTAMDVAYEATVELDELYQKEPLSYIKEILLYQLTSTDNFLSVICRQIEDEKVHKQYDYFNSNIMTKNNDETTYPASYPASLILCCAHETIDNIRLEIENNDQDINFQYAHGDTILHYTCELIQKRNDLDIPYQIIKLLLEKGALTTIKNKDQQTPIAFSFHPQRTPFFLRQYPDLIDQLVLATDEQKNNQFHLCAQHYPIIFGEIDNDLNDNGFTEYLSFLTSCKLDICAKNNAGQKPSDLACATYRKLYNRYIASKKLPLIKEALDQQEYIMQTFLCFTPLPMLEVLLALREMTDETHDPHLIKDLKPYIARLYYAINLETIAARKHRTSFGYFSDYIENKNRIRQQLLEKPEPQLLWNNS